MNVNPFKTFFLTLILGFVATVLITNLAIASPLQDVTYPQLSPQDWVAQISQPNPANGETQPKTAQPNAKVSQPGIDQAPDQHTDDQPSVQEKPLAPAQAEKAKSGGPYDMKSIEEFYKSLYGS